MNDESIKILFFIVYLVLQVWFICNLLLMVFIIKYRNLVNLYFLLGAVFGHIVGFMIAYLLYSILTKSINLERLMFIWIIPLALIPSLIAILILSYMNRHTTISKAKSIKFGFLLFFIILSIIYGFWMLRES
ncbi:hypothetical protein B9T66_08455 [Helicobacter sp. TUL]|nr:hypothetical protein B9T66_08455 [Helicobacter sp. TUL]